MGRRIRCLQISIDQNRPVVNDIEFKYHIHRYGNGIKNPKHNNAGIHLEQTSPPDHLYETRHGKDCGSGQRNKTQPGGNGIPEVVDSH